VTEDELPRDEPWFNFLQPWESPQRGWGYHRARRRWRSRHLRIFRLEQALGIIDKDWDDYSVFPWVSYPYEGW
jgi:hypothetical protein